MERYPNFSKSCGENKYDYCRVLLLTEREKWRSPPLTVCSKLFQLSGQNLLFQQWQKQFSRPPYYFLRCQYSNSADVHYSLVLANERSRFVSFGFVFKAMQAKTSVEVKGEISPSTCVYTSCYWYVRSLIPWLCTCCHFVLK